MKLKLGEAYLNNIYDSVEAYTSAPPADTNGQTVTLNQEGLSIMQNFIKRIQYSLFGEIKKKKSTQKATYILKIWLWIRFCIL